MHFFIYGGEDISKTVASVCMIISGKVNYTNMHTMTWGLSAGHVRYSHRVETRNSKISTPLAHYLCLVNWLFPPCLRLVVRGPSLTVQDYNFVYFPCSIKTVLSSMTISRNIKLEYGVMTGVIIKCYQAHIQYTVVLSNIVLLRLKACEIPKF